MRILLFILFLSCATYAGHSPLPTASNVDLNQYIGKWHAIAALPQFFTRKCIAQTAEYEILSEEKVSVLNTCLKKKGKKRTISGQAVIKNKSTNAELTVTFNNFFTRLFRVKGDYIIIKLDPGYKYVLVGTPNRKSLWLMSRDTTIPLNIQKEYLKLAKLLGFNTEKLIFSKF